MPLIPTTALGIQRWKQVGVDYAYMQPNHFWDDKGERLLPGSSLDIKARTTCNGIRIRPALLEGKPTATCTKTLPEYMSNAKSEGIYGKQPSVELLLSLTNGFY